jgi:heat-inducible transcriptional repressor
VRGAPKLTERETAILLSIVEVFVRDGRPISSADIQKEILPEVSTATIRADLYALERMGLIYKPHLSSGRLPTEAGLRYYAEEVLRKAPPTATGEREKTRVRIGDRTDFLNQTLVSLSRDAHAIAFLSHPLPEIDRIARFQVTLWEQRVLILTLLFRSDWVYSRSFRLRAPLDPDLPFDEVSERVTESIHGLLLRDIRRELVVQALRGVPSANALGWLIARFVMSHTWNDRIRLKEPPPGEMESPADQEVLHPLRRALSETETLMTVIRKMRSSPEIVWGTDLRPLPLPRSVFVLSQYRVNSLPAFLGIAGSIRMDYGRAVRMVQESSERLSASSAI